MIGTTLNNRYHLEEELGQGGMGVVYRARDIALNRVVALKVLPPAMARDEQFVERFKSEILNAARLDHPHIAQVYDVGEHAGSRYYVMQLVEGEDLHHAIVRRGRFSLRETCVIIRQLAEALDYAHAQGIVHRDIKPENILLDRQGHPFLVDFGIALAAGALRLTSGMIGTPEYMSPEQAKGEEVDGRSDQYMLAIVAYEMLTGTTPFRSSLSQPWTVVNRQISEAPPDPRTLVPLARKTAEAILKGLSKTIVQRYASCTQFADAMDVHARGMQSVSARIKISLIALSVVILTVVSMFFLHQHRVHHRETLLSRYHIPSSSAPVGTPVNDVPAPVVKSDAIVKTNPLDNAELIYIPAGDFIMGNNDHEDEKPQRLVYEDAFYIYKTAVTVAQYSKFCQATGRALPKAPFWGWIDTHPIVNVTWDDAVAYAVWAGMSLPTEAQWEKATRGTDGRIFPWGNEWEAKKCVCSENSGGQTAPVGSKSEGASPYGVLDMEGNVREWCTDWYASDYYQQAPSRNLIGPATGSARVLRGGSWDINGIENNYRAALRGSAPPDHSAPDIGFRCVASTTAQ